MDPGYDDSALTSDPYPKMEDGSFFGLNVYNDKTGLMRKELFTQ